MGKSPVSRPNNHRNTADMPACRFAQKTVNRILPSSSRIAQKVRPGTCSNQLQSLGWPSASLAGVSTVRPPNCLAKKRLESGQVRWEFPRMKTLTVDDRQRIRLPKAKPGAVFAYEPNLDGTIKLVPVVPKPGPRRVVARLIKRGKGMFFQVPTGYTLDPQAIGKAVAEERESRS
jgi:hypothetical protein